MPNRSVLLISYNFPPGGGVGAIRIAKFAKYLPDEWDIHVLTTPRNTVRGSSESIDAGVNTSVHEVPPVWSDAPKDFDQLRWAPRLVDAIRRLHKKHRFDCIWHTAGPFLPLTAVPLVTRMVDIPYIVDLRDSWTLHPYRKQTTIFGRLGNAISRVAEPRVLKDAAAVTVATDGMRRAYDDAYPSLGHTFRTITNGYDPDDFPEIDTERRDEFTIVYVGKFSDFRDPDPFFQAFADVRSRTDASFVHVGNPEQAVESAVERVGLSDTYECTGYVNRTEVAQWIQRSDLGLAVSGDSPQEMTTKIFDYIACGTPILACGPPNGSMAGVVEQFEFGHVVPNNAGQIADVLPDIIENRPPSLGDGPYDQYTRARSAEQLAQLIDELCTGA